MCSFEGDDAPDAGDGYGDERFGNADDVPCNVDIALLCDRNTVRVVLDRGESSDQYAIENTSDRRGGDDGSNRDDGLLVLLGIEQGDAILAREGETRRHKYKAERPEDLKIDYFLARFPLYAHDRKPNHHTEVKCFGNAFENRIGTKAYIIQRNLIPCQPEEGEETNVCRQGVPVVDLQHRSKCRQVGHEEQIVEELRGRSFCMLVV